MYFIITSRGEGFFCWEVINAVYDSGSEHDFLFVFRSLDVYETDIVYFKTHTF